MHRSNSSPSALTRTPTHTDFPSSNLIAEQRSLKRKQILMIYINICICLGVTRDLTVMVLQDFNWMHEGDLGSPRRADGHVVQQE